MNISIDEIEERVSKVLPKKRFLHTQSVAYLACSIAMAYGQDHNKAMIAGLLHDYAKYMTDDDAINLCIKENIPITSTEQEHPYLLHGKIGAYYAKTIFGITDSDILSAIQYHTTGKPAMTFLEKTIFVADYIEYRRTQPTTPSLDEIRQIAFTNLDLAVYYELSNTIAYLTSTNSDIDTMSLQTFEYYKQLLNR